MNDDGMGGAPTEQQETTTQAPEATAPATQAELDWLTAEENRRMAATRGWKTADDAARSYSEVEKAFSRSQNDLAAERQQREALEARLAQYQEPAYQGAPQNPYPAQQQPDQGLENIDLYAVAAQFYDGDVNVAFREVQRALAQQQAEQQARAAEEAERQEFRSILQQERAARQVTEMEQRYGDRWREVGQDVLTQLRDAIDPKARGYDPGLAQRQDAMEILFAKEIARRDAEAARARGQQAAGQSLDGGAMAGQRAAATPGDAVLAAMDATRPTVADGL